MTDGAPDMLAQLLLGYGILQILILLRLWPWLREQPFGAGYWGYSFAIAALATGSLRFVERGLGDVFEPIAVVCFLFANLVIGLIALGTVALLLRGKLLPPPAVTVR
ncbi:MAG: hypothetical protein WDO24_17340 [Pseudomonadota bacterium]